MRRISVFIICITILFSHSMLYPVNAICTGCDPSHAGAIQKTDGIASQSNSLLWEFNASNAIITTPIFSNGLVYVCTNSTMLAIDNVTGKQKWTLPVVNPLALQPFVYEDLIFISSDSKLVCLECSTGKKVWTADIQYGIKSQPNASFGKVVVATANQIICFDSKTGLKLWDFNVTNGISSASCIYNKNVYFGTNDKTLVCLSLNEGYKLWELILEGTVSQPIVAASERVYAVYGDTIFAIECDSGKARWKFRAQKKGFTPSVFGDKVFFPSEDFMTYCLDGKFFGKACCVSTGKKNWSFMANSECTSQPIACGEVVYQRATDGNLYCIDASEGKLLWRFDVGKNLDLSSIFDGRLFVVEDKKIFCYTNFATSVKMSIGKYTMQRDRFEVPVDSAPVIINGKTFIPAKYIVEPFGGTTSWSPQDKRVTCKYNSNILQVWVGKNTAQIGIRKVQIDSNPALVPTIIGGRVFLPMRFLAETFMGLKIDWNDKEKSIVIKNEI